MAYKCDAKIPERFETLEKECEEAGDRKFCSVIAICLITGEPSEKVRKALADNGRRAKCGAKPAVVKRALNDLGYKVKKWAPKQHLKIIHDYPQPHDRLMNITTHHPRRFPSAWEGQPDVLMLNAKHITAFIDGEFCDWAIKHSNQVREIWQVEKKS